MRPIAEQHGKMTLQEFRNFVLDVGSTSNGVFGISILWGDFSNIIQNYQELVPYQELNAYEIMGKLFNNPKYIWLTRQDTVQQAISLEKAIQTAVWRKSTHEKFDGKREPKFDFERIEFRRKKLEAGNLHWQKFFEMHEIVPFKVVYEELADNYEQTAIDILGFLGVAHPEAIEFGERHLQKQADKLSKEWIDQYYKIKRFRMSLLVQIWLKSKKYIRSISIRKHFQK